MGRDAVAAVDREGLVRDIEAQPHQLEEALWRVESAGVPRRERTGGLVVCGMGGSAIGADLANGALGARARLPVRTVGGYRIAPEPIGDALVLCASYSGDTEETLACFQEAGSAGAERVALTTGGQLAAEARAEGVPVIGAPAGMQPRSAVAYMLVGTLECAALCGAAPPLREEVEKASRLLARLAEDWGPGGPAAALPKQVARRLLGCLPVVYGAGATAPIALRWKTQLNENAKLPAFHATLPEADHNELSGWEGANGLAPLGAVLLDDPGAEERLRRRVRATASELGSHAAELVELEVPGDSQLERVAAGVMLGDLVSVYLAVLRGVDPTPVEAIERFKQALDSGAGSSPR